MTGWLFNIDSGYLEGLCRGFKCGILKQSDYLNLVQCETLEGKRKIIKFNILVILLSLSYDKSFEELIIDYFVHPANHLLGILMKI